MRRTWILVLAALATLVATQSASSQDQNDAAKQMEAMKRWMDALKPNEHHKRLARYIGEWDTEMVIQGMGKSAGKATVTWAIENKALMMVATGQMMGRPSKSVALVTWDTMKQKAQFAMVSSTHYGMLTAEGGIVDKTHKVEVMYGPMDEILTGEHDRTVKYVTRWKDNNTYVQEVWDMGIGENGKAVVSTTYTRRTDADPAKR
ncbi:MAG: DUF1579 family protein [Planctomycetota bacterium]|jgi:hypothetical protein